MGRNRKPVQIKKMEGTFRADRDSAQESAELAVSAVPGVIFARGSKVTCPKTVTDKYVRSYWKKLTANLIALQLLSCNDLPMLENMMITLQNLRTAQSALSALDITDIALQKRYEMLHGVVVKLTASFNDMAVKFYISPAARNKLTLETLTGQKLVQEIEKNKSPVSTVLDIRKKRNE